MAEAESQRFRPADPDCIEGDIQNRPAGVPVDIDAKIYMKDGGSAIRSDDEGIIDPSVIGPSTVDPNMSDLSIVNPSRTDSRVVYRGLSEGLETRRSMATKQVVFVVKDIDERLHGIITWIDSGVEHSFISPKTVKLLGYKQRPLFDKDTVLLSSPLNELPKVKVTHYVGLQITCMELGLDTEPIHVGVLKAHDCWGILIGREFLDNRKLWGKIGDLKVQEDRQSFGSFGSLRDSRTRRDKYEDSTAHEQRKELAASLTRNWETSSSSKQSIASSNTDLKAKSSSISSQSSAEARPKGA